MLRLKRVVESKKKSVSWSNTNVQARIENAIEGLVVDKEKTTSNELIFTYDGKNGSMRLQGYMVVLDLDTEDDIPPTYYPVKDKNNLSITNLLNTVRTVFTKREAMTESRDTRKKGSFFVIHGDTKDTLINGGDPEWNEVFNYEEYSTKESAISAAKEKVKESSSAREHGVFGVVGPVDPVMFEEDTFWDALVDGDLDIVWLSTDASEKEEGYNNIGSYKCESVEDHISSPVFADIANTRLYDALNNSLILSKKNRKNNPVCSSCPDANKVIWVYLSPTYAINKLSDILVPVCLNNRMISMPIADIPKPEMVFNGDYTENAVRDYNKSVQDFIINDAPMSELMDLNLDNVSEVKSRIADIINSMSEDYQSNRDSLESDLEITGETLLKESRYFIVPSETDLSSEEEVKKITPMGFTDLHIAKSNLNDMTGSGKYDYDLRILDTHFSNNKNKWELL